MRGSPSDVAEGPEGDIGTKHFARDAAIYSSQERHLGGAYPLFSCRVVWHIPTDFMVWRGMPHHAQGTMKPKPWSLPTATDAIHKSRRAVAESLELIQRVGR